MIPSRSNETATEKESDMNVTNCKRIKVLPGKFFFSRKESRVADVCWPSASSPEDGMKASIVKQVCMTLAEYDAFSQNMLGNHSWCDNVGGVTPQGVALCILVYVKEGTRPRLLVNPEGGCYARYVARV